MKVYELIQQLSKFNADTEVEFHVKAKFDADVEAEFDRDDEDDTQEVTVVYGSFILFRVRAERHGR